MMMELIESLMMHIKLKRGIQIRAEIKFEGAEIIFVPSEIPMYKTNKGKYTIKKIENSKLEFIMLENQCDRRHSLFGRKLTLIRP